MLSDILIALAKTPSIPVTSTPHKAASPSPWSFFNFGGLLGNIPFLIILLVGGAFAIMVAFVAGYSMGSKKKSGIAKYFAEAKEGKIPALALTYDINTSEWDLVPLERLGEGLLISKDHRRPLIMFKDVRIRAHSFRGVPTYFAFTIGDKAVATNPEALVKAGIASLTIKSKYWHTTTQPNIALRNLIGQVLSEASQKNTELTVTPNLKIGLTIEIPPVISAIMSTVIQTATGVLHSLLDVSKMRDDIKKKLESIEKGKIEAKGKFLQMVAVAVFIVIVGAVIMMAVLFHFGR